MASRKKHLAIRCSKRPWRNGERERVGTYFKQISLFRTRCIYVARRTGAVCMYIYRLDAPGRDSPFFFAEGGRRGGEEGFEFKRFKAISLGVARRIVGSQTPIDRRFFFSFLPSPFFTPHTHFLSTVVLLIPFRFLLPIRFVTYCELLREPRRPAEKDSALSLSMRKISCDMKNGADALAARLVSSRLVSTRAVGIASFVVCDNNFYDAHWLSEERRRYCGPRRGKPRCDERGLGRAFHKIPRAICFKRARGM